MWLSFTSFMKTVSYFNPPLLFHKHCGQHFLRLRILIRLDLATFYKSFIKCGSSKSARQYFTVNFSAKTKAY